MKPEQFLSEEPVTMDEVAVTRQGSRPAAPPSPQPPIPVPNDQVIPEEIHLPTQNLLDEFPKESEFAGAGGNSEEGRIYRNPGVPPSVVKIVEPTMPEAAKKAKIRVEITVSFLVDRKGNVEEASISEIRRYGDKGRQFEMVQTIGYGLTEATLQAALQWKFRPARQNGQPVKAYSQHIFSYGF